jgi:hypothetical protein
VFKGRRPTTTHAIAQRVEIPGYAARSADERISSREPRKPAEVPIDRPQFAHAMETAESGNPRVVDLGPGDPSLLQGRPEIGPVPFGLCEQG